MNASKLFTAGAVTMTLLLGGCTVSNTTSVEGGTATPAMMTKETPAMTAEPTAAMLKPEDVTGATRIDGKVILIGKDGTYQILTENEATIGTAKVMMDGKVVGKDGSSAVLTEGMALDMQGAIKALDTKTVINAKRQLMMPQDNGAMKANPEPGAYQDYTPEKLAAAKTGKVVLFFRGSACATCNTVDADIMKNLSTIPGNIRILKVDYATHEQLVTKYGGISQGTFVQVDADGKILKKWSGSPTLSVLLSEVI